MKKRRLKKWVRDLISFLPALGVMIVFVIMFMVGCSRFEEVGKECDEYYGYTCSSYQVEQFGKGIRR